MAANPDMLKVLLSGFTQEIYGQTHRKGDIELVKRNMANVASHYPDTTLTRVKPLKIPRLAFQGQT